MARWAARAEKQPARTIADLIAAGALPKGFGRRPDGSTPIWKGDTVVDSLRGPRGSFLPVPDVPIRAVTAAPDDVGLTYEDVRITSEDGVELSAWFIPAEGAETTLLFFHGNAGNISHRLDSIRIFHDLGLDAPTAEIEARGSGFRSFLESCLCLHVLQAAHD